MTVIASMDPETATVEVTDASVRGIEVDQQWHIAIGLDTLRSAAELLIDQAEEEGQETREAVCEIVPHPEYGDGVVIKLVRD